MKRTNEDLLSEYKKTNNVKLRDQCIKQCTGLAITIVNSFKKTYTHIPVEDLEAEAFLELTESAETFIPKSIKFTTYATLNIQFKLTQYINKERGNGITWQGKKQVTMTELDDYITDDGNERMESHVAQKEMERLINDLSFDREYKKLFRRHFIKGMSNMDIAKEFKVTQQAVSKRLQKLYGLIREQLQINSVSDIKD